MYKIRVPRYLLKEFARDWDRETATRNNQTEGTKESENNY